MFKKWFILVLSLIVANILTYQVLAFIQWDWNFDSWHWFARTVLILIGLGTIGDFIKKLKE